MNWTRRFWTPGEAESANLRDRTIIDLDRAPYDVSKAVGSPKTLPALGDPEVHIAEEIKRRQIALAVRYVAAVRAR